MLHIRNGAIRIPESSNSIAVIESEPIEFNVPVFEAYVALSGFRAQYTKSDHHVKLFKVTTEARITNNQSGTRGMVTITGELWLRDNNADDKYNGSLYYTVFIKTGAELPNSISL
jgi:hypothetical protein